MNDEPRFSTYSVIAMTCWVATGLLLAVAWVSWMVGGEPYVAILVAETACVGSAVAAVAHIRVYVARLCRVIRVGSGLQSPSADVRDLPPRR